MKRSMLLLVWVLLVSTAITFGQNISVNFKCDMTVKIKQLGFNPATDILTVAGNFNGWSGTLNPLTKGANDSIYTLAIDTFHVNDTLFYKFVINGSTWEKDPNRRVIVPAGGITVKTWWNDDSVYAPPMNGNINFKVDLSAQKEIGIYKSNIDSLQVRGIFNGWNGDDRPRSHMNKNGVNNALWSLNVPFTNEPLNSAEPFKFYIALGDTARSNHWTDGWERPLSSGGGNRPLTFLGDPSQDAGTIYFDDGKPENVITTASGNKDITFKVDMVDAMNSTLFPTPFNPATDQVYWIPRQPSWVFSQGLPDTDTSQVYPMTLESGTIYKGTVTVKAPAINGMLYIYGFKHPATNGFIKEKTDGTNAFRARYIKQTNARVFVQPYTAPTDKFTDGPKEWESSALSVQIENGTTPSAYTLSQNYPNPFNPSTVISFSVPKSGLVTLKVYNLLGQEVATLVNENLAANSYKVTFDAKNLTSGVYFYNIKAGDFSLSKKMMFVK